MMRETEKKWLYIRWGVIRLAMVLFDILAVNFSYFIALMIRYYVASEFLEMATKFIPAFLSFAPFYTVCCLVVFGICRLYSGMWKYAGVNDLNRILLASVVTAAIHVVGTLLFVMRMPATYYILGAGIQFMLITASRFSYRVLTAERRVALRGRSETALNVMIVGVGETSSIVRRKLESDPQSGVRPVCIFSEKSGTSGMVDGIPLVCGMDRLKETIEKYHVECVMLADSVLPEEHRKNIQAVCKELQVEVQDFSGYFNVETGGLPVRKLLGYTTGPVELVAEDGAYTFANGEQAAMSLRGSYDIESISASNGKLVLNLTKHKVTLNDLNESWVQKFEQETGESVSFF